MKYLASSAIALCVCGASGVYFVSDEDHSTPEIVETKKAKLKRKFLKNYKKRTIFYFALFWNARSKILPK